MREAKVPTMSVYYKTAKIANGGWRFELNLKGWKFCCCFFSD